MSDQNRPDNVENMTYEILSIVRRIDQRTDDHSGDLHEIASGMSTMSKIDINIQRMADSIEKITQKAFDSMSGRTFISIKAHSITLAIVGAMFLVTIFAITKTHLKLESSSGSRATVGHENAH